MNLQPVTSAKTNPFTFKCLGCGRTVKTDRERTYADLDGPAFRSYYCQRCHDRSITSTETPVAR